MRTLRILSTALLLAPLSACSGASSSHVAQPAPAATAADTSGAEAAPVDLLGEWMEYWAVAGTADTQRYRFEPDGRFEWRTAVTAQDQPRERTGHYAIEGREIVLTVEREVMGGSCTTECEHVLEHGKQERLELAECPPNEEARALDASYRCQSIGSRIFWLRSTK